MVLKEKRKIERFELKVFSKIKLEPAWDYTDTIELNTKNVSSKGAYFKTLKPLPLGTSVSMTMKLKVNNNLKSTINLVAIEVTGKVIRSENEGMAILFDNGFKMLPLGNKPKKKKL